MPVWRPRQDMWWKGSVKPMQKNLKQPPRSVPGTRFYAHYNCSVAINGYQATWTSPRPSTAVTPFPGRCMHHNLVNVDFPDIIPDNYSNWRRHVMAFWMDPMHGTNISCECPPKRWDIDKAQEIHAYSTWLPMTRPRRWREWSVWQRTIFYMVEMMNTGRRCSGSMRTTSLENSLKVMDVLSEKKSTADLMEVFWSINHCLRRRSSRFFWPRPENRRNMPTVLTKKSANLEGYLEACLGLPRKQDRTCPDG